MPWTAKSYREKHNKKLSLAEAGKAAKQATAMIKAGVPEGEAIATANKNAAPKKKNPIPASRATRYANPRKRKMDVANAITGDVLLPGQG